MGDLDADDLYGTFNMGLGMILAVAPENAAAVQDALKQAGEDSCRSAGCRIDQLMKKN